MRYLALATDYDGTLATHGRVDQETLAALRRLADSGRRLLLVTGRELPDLQQVFPELDVFDLVVAENGALLYWPRTKAERVLAEAPPAAFIERLRQRGVQPLSVGRCIVATWEPHQATVLETIKELGLELQVIFNKGAVMVLPAGVNKGSGLKAALTDLRLSPHNVVGLGDAENDHAFLSVCECSVAVANALETLKQRADITTRGDHGTGVREIIEALLRDDLAEAEPHLTRHRILLGHDREDREVYIAPHGECLLIAGPSGSGKSTAVAALLERLCEHEYQFCVVDPEGDFEQLPEAVTLGDAHHPVNLEEVLRLLERFENANVNLLGIALNARPEFFAAALPRLQELRATTGRPHWLVIDETHHLLPSSWRPAPMTVPQSFGSVALITVHPDHVATAALSAVTVVLAVGEKPEETIGALCGALGEEPPEVPARDGERRESMIWFRRRGDAAVPIRIAPGTSERRRHRRKYSVGDLHDEAFIFRGPEGKLRLRAQNLSLFLQMAEGVDDETWLHHLRQGDYSEWIRVAIKDEPLADEVARIEQSNGSPGETRAAIKDAIEKQYTSAA